LCCHQLAYQQHSYITPSGAIERRRDGNHSPQTNNSKQDSLGTEENGYPDPGLNKTMINITKEPSDTHIKTLKEEILEDITEKFMEKMLNMINQNV
jgi:dihydroorotate dehydrogenase